MPKYSKYISNLFFPELEKMKSFIAVLFLVGCVVGLGKDIWGMLR